MSLQEAGEALSDVPCCADLDWHVRFPGKQMVARLTNDAGGHLLLCTTEACSQIIFDFATWKRHCAYMRETRQQWRQMHGQGWSRSCADARFARSNSLLLLTWRDVARFLAQHITHRARRLAR